MNNYIANVNNIYQATQDSKIKTQKSQDMTSNLKSVDKNKQSEFAKTLANSMTQQLTQQAITIQTNTGTDGAGSGLGVQNQFETQNILLQKALTNQSLDKSEIALFMLCTFMQNMQQNSMPPLMTAMAALLPQIEKIDKQTVDSALNGANFDQNIKNNVRQTVLYQGGYDTAGIGHNNKISADFENEVLPSQAWLPTSVKITSNQENRNPQLLRDVIDQFQVESAQRYMPYKYGSDTYCNIFVWDVTSALGCEIPHYVDSTTGNIRQYPNISGATELGATATLDWLQQHGQRHGWYEVTQEQAQNFANNGQPVVTAGSGHVSMVCPSNDLQYNKARGATVAQAGKNNYNYAHLSSTYNKEQLKTVKFFVHA